MYGAVRRGLDSPEVVVVEGFAARSGNVWRLHSLDGSERNLVVLDGVAGKWAGRVGTCGDVTRWCLWIGEGVVLTVDGSGVRGLLILRGRDEERSKTVVGEGLHPVVMRRGSVRSIPSHLSRRHFSRYVSVRNGEVIRYLRIAIRVIPLAVASLVRSLLTLSTIDCLSRTDKGTSIGGVDSRSLNFKSHGGGAESIAGRGHMGYEVRYGG